MTTQNNRHLDLIEMKNVSIARRTSNHTVPCLIKEYFGIFCYLFPPKYCFRQFPGSKDD